MTLRVERFAANLRPDFYRVHCEEYGSGWCYCVAWWVSTWEGWADRSADENRALRDTLCDRGEYDGYLLYENDEPIGWCQVGPRDRLEKLRRQFQVAPDPGTWAVTCFSIRPESRRRGLAGRFLDAILADLRDRGVRKVEAFPRRGRIEDAADLWTGPESIYLRRSFEPVEDDDTRPVLALLLEKADPEDA